MSMSSQSRQLVLEATVAFRLREYERAVKLLTSLDSLLSGGNDVVKHNLVVAQWYAAQQIYSTSFAQWLDIHESIPKGKPCTNAAFIAQFNQSVYYFYANQPQKALEALQSLCFTGRKAESRLETSSVLLALDLFLGTRNIQQAVEYFEKLNLSELDAVAAPSDAKSFYDIIYHLYEARIQLASGRKWDAVNSLLQLSIPDEQESNGRVLGVAHWHLRSQLAMACYQTDTAYDLVAWHTDTADSKAVDQNARGCMYFEQSKWGLASFAFSQAAQLLKESEKDHSDVEDKQLLPVNHSRLYRWINGSI
ncbi:hypothetical protein BDF19DRAFT_223757 [Syncephalis fuscata]|nr:hypothetical protein BDF19DRAFT_223757 [Syncephalis fuscata]